MLELVTPGLWTATAPLSFFGLHFGARMTLVDTGDGLLLHSPIQATPALVAAVRERGELRWLMGPNMFHHLYLQGWVEAFPEAELWGPPGLVAKRKRLSFDGVLDGTSAPWGTRCVRIAGMGRLDEVALYQASTRTLVVCDLLQNFPTHEHWLTRNYLNLAGALGQPGLSVAIKMAFDDKKAGRKSIDELLDLPFERVVMSHGQVLEADAKEQFRRVWSWM
jgi:hypothetical protein